eukprot:CAMPEP_0196597278 /NCGR_PEP_ID=MMETSP1081-20130531/90558_1 /TAXON_ID=36882 /ORGANISM="Pyramimonas amylifera, Strain CCMP720" /LENGTH=68 /DNA_ID=CAMNT_0041922613 /DNA_START=62 /DNA_END=264 /DNA_ORIENTATION=-
MKKSLSPQQISGPSVWYGAELSEFPESWARTLTAEEVAEVEQAVQKQRGLEVASITQETFELPSLGPV